MDIATRERTARNPDGTSVSKPLRVLILEDNPRDIELCIEELKKAGFKLQGDAVDTEEAFAAKLHSSVYDLILSDYRIPAWSGVEAFQLVKQSGKDIPFILVTGTLREEAAVDLIKQGVADYILKDRLARLPVAVHRALREKTTRDERERAIQSLRESEQQVRLLLESTAEAIYGIDVQGICTFCNAASARLLGYDNPVELIGKQMHWLMHHTRADGTPYPIEECQIYKGFREGCGSHADNEVLWRKDGSSFPVEYWSYPVVRDGKAIGSVVTFLDITERKQAEGEIRKERDRAQQYFDIADVILLALDKEGRINLINRKGCSTLGWEEQDLIGRNWINTCLPAKVRESLARSFQKLIDGDTSYVENPVLTKSGEKRIIGWHNTLLRDATGCVTGTLSSGEDITERKRTEEALRRSEARMRRLVESNVIGIGIGTLDGKLFDGNDAFLKLLGYSREELRTGVLRWDDITPSEYNAVDQQAVEQLRNTGIAHAWEKEFIRKDGSRVAVLIGIVTLTTEQDDIEAVSFVVDISERKQLEKQLRMAQKMEAVGQLAGGIAHDFNNLIAVVVGYSELVQEKLGEANPLRPKVAEIEKAGRRAAVLTRQLLTFSRQQILEPTTLNLNLIVTDVQKMLQRLIGEHIELATSLEPDIPSVRADQGHIEQVIMNLAVNARDAMPEGGKLTIETATVELDGRYASFENEVMSGSFVMLIVRDTGIGMNAETLTHIFEPFFTTKEPGRGTGLGLATVYGVVKQSGGHLRVHSEPGHGTTFMIYFPRVQKEVNKELQTTGPETFVRGTETILLVEDEESVNKMARELLEESGYSVLDARDGWEALDIAGKYEGTIHLLLTDVVMPKMGGAALAKQLASLRPETRVLYMSGYTRGPRFAEELAESGSELLQKPFTRYTLTRKIRDVLDGSAEYVADRGHASGSENKSCSES